MQAVPTEDRCKPLKILTTKTCSCAPTPRMVEKQACAVCKMAKLAGDENRAIECVRLLEPIPPDVLGRLRSHYFKYMRIAEQPAVWGPLEANIRAIPVKGFSHEAVQTICRYLNLPIWCPVPNGDLVRCSWIDSFCDFTTRFRCVPTVISPRKSAGWHAQRLARCVTSILYENGCNLLPVKSYHLSCFGFGKINSTHCALGFANPNAVLAILLSACLHFEGKAFGVRKAAAKWFPDFNLLAAAD